MFPSFGASGHAVELQHLYRRISRATGTGFWFHGLRNVFITVAERELMLQRSLTKRLVNHARGSDVTEGYAADWSVEQLREVLRGNPNVVAAVADSLDFEHKYRSLVITWAPDDRPTDEQIGAVLDEFEKTAWAGLEPDRYAWTAVPHREHGDGVHVHVLTARCDLETGRSLNIAPSGWRKTFDALRDAFNHQHGWSRPDDPARARAHQPGHRAYLDTAKLRTGLDHEAGPRELIREYLLQRVEHGAVRNRADVAGSPTWQPGRGAGAPERFSLPRPSGAGRIPYAPWRGFNQPVVRNPGRGAESGLRSEQDAHSPLRIDAPSPGAPSQFPGPPRLGNLPS